MAPVLLPGCVGGDAARVQKNPSTVARCFERSRLETSPARGLLAEEAEVGAVAVRFRGENRAKVVVEQTEEAARRTVRSYRTSVPLDPPLVRQKGSVVVVFDRPPQSDEEEVVSRCTGVRR